MATQTELASHLDLTDRSVRELITRGILPQSARKAMDVDACRMAYIRHLREMAAGWNRPVADDLDTERARLAKEQADHVALKNEAMRKRLLSRVKITNAVTHAFGVVRDRLLSLPGKLAVTVSAMTEVGEVRAVLVREVEDALRELSEERVIAEAETVNGP